jgi:glycerol kinase
MSGYILALDEGTSSARAAIYNRAGERVAMESVPFGTSYPQPGWVEQDAEEIWQAQLEAARGAMARAGIGGGEIAALGITNQRETAVVWERRSGKPVAPAIVWQCRRTAARCQQLDGKRIAARTGLMADAYFSGPKFEWILDHVRPGREGDWLCGTIDAWLIWKLTGGRVHATDVTNASRTMLMDLERGQWDRELLELFGIPERMLPRIVGSSEVIGQTEASHFGAEIPIAGVAGDQQAALFGQACFRHGLSKNTYGTGCFALFHTGGERRQPANGLLGTRAAAAGREAAFALEGSVFVAGAAVQWLRDQLKLIPTAAASQAMAESVADSGGVYVVPAFVGLGAPYWDQHARGAIVGITRGSTSAHIVRATLESIAYQTRDLVEAMEAEAGEPLEELRVDGGASANDFLMQFQADILNRRIVRPADIETTALGAAYLAGLAAGVWASTEQLEQFWQAGRVFEPRLEASRREELYAGWKEAVGRTLTRR